MRARRALSHWFSMAPVGMRSSLLNRKTVLVLIALAAVTGVCFPDMGRAQSLERANRLTNEAYRLINAPTSHQDLQDALKKLQTALPIYEKAGRLKEAGAAYNLMGLIHNAGGEHEEALKRFEKSLSICDQLRDLKGKEIALSNSGAIFKTRGQYEEALRRYEKALALAASSRDRHGEGVCLNNIGLLRRSETRCAEVTDPTG